jgi:hypothetical protein
MEIKAKLLEKYDTATISGTFRKREFVVEFAENPQYPEFVKFELIQDKCDQLDGFNVGQELSIAFNLKGRKWTNPKGEDVYFNSLQAWRISAANDVSAAPAASLSQSGTAPQADSAASDSLKEPEWLNTEGNAEADDLPF